MTRFPKTNEEWLAAVPVARVEHHVREDGGITLLRPKFMSPRLQWLQRMLRRPHFRVKLDEVGSCLWAHLDGTRNAAELSETLRLAFGQRIEPAEDRTLSFLAQLAKGNFVELG